MTRFNLTPQAKPQARRSGPSRETVIAAMIGVGLLGVAAAGVFFWPAPAIQRHGETHCPLNTTPPIHVVAIVDRTDPWSHDVTWRVHGELLAIAQRLPTGGKLSLLPLTGRAKEADVPLFVACKPDNGATASWLTDNPTLKRQRFAQIFMAPLQQIATDLAKPQHHDTTPMIRYLAELTSRLQYQSANTQLIVFSDMRQHDDTLSLFGRRRPTPQRFADHLKAALGRRLMGRHITIHVLPTSTSPGALSPARVKAYWLPALKALSATVIWRAL